MSTDSSDLLINLKGGRNVIAYDNVINTSLVAGSPNKSSF